MRIVLETLFQKVNELNNLYESLGSEKQYGIRFVSSNIENKFDSFNEVYSNLDELKKNLEEETYFENIDNAIVEVMETAKNIDDIEYEVTFDEKIPDKARSKQTVYAHLSEI